MEEVNIDETPYIGIEGNYLNNDIVVKHTYKRKCNKILIKKTCIGISCITVILVIIGVIILDAKCDVFTNKIAICDLPNYCLIKNKCYDGSNFL